MVVARKKRNSSGGIEMSEEIIKEQEGTPSTEDVKNVIPRERFNEVNAKLKEANNLIAELRAKEKQYETYVPADKLAEAQAAAKAEAEAKINEFAIKADLKVSLIEKGFTAKQIDLILSQADTTGLKRDGEKVIGLNDVAEKLYGEYKEVFGLKALGVNNTGAAAGGTAPGAGYTAEQLSKMSDAEYFAYKESLKK